MVGATVVALDLGVKALVHTRLKHSVALPGPFRLTPSSNTGISFGQFGGHALLTVFLSLAFVVLCGVLVARSGSSLVAGGFMLVAAGGLANAIDRMTHQGSVTDFLQVGSLFVCNVADIAISIGVLVVIVQVCTGRNVLR